jgi:nicotinamidase/pyrazinamidase
LRQETFEGNTNMKIEPGANDVLVVVDVQNDFCAGGALPTARGHAIVPVINQLAQRFENVVLTQDWHPRGHVSFASSHEGRQPFDVVEMPYGPQVLWPDHVVQGTPGAQFHADLDIPHAQLVIRKGYNRNVDSYSAFRMVDGVTMTGLAGYVRERNIGRIFVAGIATDYCVSGLALDANSLGFETLVIVDASAAVDEEGTGAAALEKMRSEGIALVKSADFQQDA